MQDESQDYIKRQQLRELAMLNSNFREDSPGPSGSVSPFNSSGMKRAKTGRWEFISITLWNGFHPAPEFQASVYRLIPLSSAQLPKIRLTVLAGEISGGFSYILVFFWNKMKTTMKDIKKNYIVGSWVLGLLRSVIPVNLIHSFDLFLCQ